jgi:hypothetical protein
MANLDAIIVGQGSGSRNLAGIIKNNNLIQRPSLIFQRKNYLRKSSGLLWVTTTATVFI